jgi:hypothetical protein
MRPCSVCDRPTRLLVNDEPLCPKCNYEREVEKIQRAIERWEQEIAKERTPPGPETGDQRDGRAAGGVRARPY